MRFIRHTSKTAVYAKIFNRTVHVLLKEPVSGTGMQDGLLNNQKYLKNTRIQSPTEMTSIEAARKSNESEVYKKVRNKRTEESQIPREEV